MTEVTKFMRVATIDIGTNTVLLLIAERVRGGEVHAVTEAATITRLGEGVDRTRQLLPAAVARTRDCLREYERQIASAGVERVAVVGTSAMRDAAGGEELRAFVRTAFGVDVRVLTGRQEARLTFSGALHGMPPMGAGQVGVFDIGGGSTEVVMGVADGPAKGIAYAESFDVGSVRMTERLIRGDPPAADELEAVRSAAAEGFRRVPSLHSEVSPIGVAGTMTTLASVALGISKYDPARIHGHMLGYDELRSVVLSLAAMPVDVRRAVPGIEPKRADVIVAGGLIALALLEHWQSPSVIVSDRGVRWGLAVDLLAGASPPDGS